MKNIIKILAFSIVLNALYFNAFAADEQRQLLDCNAIFEARKNEILAELARVDEQQQAISALQTAQAEILEQKEADLKKREDQIAAIKAEVVEREENIKRIAKKNEETLRQMRSASNSKVGTTYSSMKDSKAAKILEALPREQAAEILYGLDTKISSKILAKITPAISAELTQLISKGPPFEPQQNIEQKPNPAASAPGPAVADEE